MGKRGAAWVVGVLVLAASVLGAGSGTAHGTTPQVVPHGVGGSPPQATLGDIQAGILGTYFIVPVGVKFEGTYEYSLSKRGVAVSDPVWTTDYYGRVLKNDPACFKRYTSFSVRADIASTTSVPPGGLQVKVRCSGHHAGTGASVLPAVEKTLTITGWSTADYATLLWSSSSLPNAVAKYPLHLLFEFWVYQGGVWVWQNQYESGTHSLYVTLAAPLTPMGSPWIEVIDRATTWSDGLSSESTISDDLVSDLYNATWTYTPGISHTWRGTEDPTDQYFELDKMLDATQGDCKDFGNLYACLMRCLGIDGRAYFLWGPFDTRPLLGSHLGSWTTYSFSHHQFGWDTSLVHDACVKVDQSAPKYAVNMNRDTTYKGYAYSSGTWNPVNYVICKLGAPPVPEPPPWPTSLSLFSATEATALSLSHMGQGISYWTTSTGSAEAHSEELAAADGLWVVHVKYAIFETDEEASSASQAEVSWCEATGEPGSYSGLPVGDACWHWSESVPGLQMVFRTGNVAASIVLECREGSASQYEAVLEAVAQAAVRRIRAADFLAD